MDAVALCWRRGIDSLDIARELVRHPAQRDALAAVAADLDAPLPVRITATAALVEAAAIGDVDVPPALADALDDLAFVDGAVAAKRGSVICALLHYLGAGPDLASTRRRVVRRLVVAGHTGLPLAGLALQIGDLAPGALLAAADFSAVIAPRLANLAPDHDVAAWGRWLVNLPTPAAQAVVVALGDRVRGLLRHAAPTEATRISAMLSTS